MSDPCERFAGAQRTINSRVAFDHPHIPLSSVSCSADRPPPIMSRHRDVRNMSYDDYDDEDEDYDQTGAGSYGAGSPATASAFLYQRQPTGAELAAQHHREHVASGGRGGAAAAAAPRATATSAAFFKTKPAKKGKGAARASGGWQASTNAGETVGAAEPEELFGGDDFDAETAAAIEASAREARAKEQFLIEAGLVKPKPAPAATSASVVQAPPPSSSPGPGFRSASDQQATLAALEELRLSKQRSQTGSGAGSNPLSATSTPKRQVSNEPAQSSGAAAAALAGATPFVSPIKIDRHARAPSSAASASAADSLAVPAVDGSPITTPRSPNASPSGSPTPQAAASSSSSCSASAILPDVAPPERSQKRVREVDAVLQSEAQREAAEAGAGGGPPKDRLNMVVIGHVDAGA